MEYRTIHPQFNNTFEYYAGIPSLTREALWNYMAYGLPPGGFLSAVLENDLFFAIFRADHTWDARSLKDLVGWISYYAPVGSYGCTDNIAAWCRLSNEQRRDTMIERKLRPSVVDILSGVAIA